MYFTDLYQINLIRRLEIKSALRGGPRDLALQIGVIGYYTKLTRLEVFYVAVSIVRHGDLALPNRGNWVLPTTLEKL